MMQVATRTPGFDGKRFVRAVLVGLACFVLAGGGIGFALAATEQAADKDSLALPAPRPGDRVSYHVHRAIINPAVALGGMGDQQLDDVEYEWLPETWVSDADFGLRLAHPLKGRWAFMTQSDEPKVIERTVYYDAIDGHVLVDAWHGVETWHSSLGVGGLGVGPSDPLEQSTTLNSTTDYYQGLRPPCGMSTPLHGAATTPGSLVPIRGRCTWGQDAAAPVAFHAEGWEDLPDSWLDLPSGWSAAASEWSKWGDASEWDDYSGIELQSDPSEPSSGGAFALRAVDDPEVTLWYDQDSPFPVRMQVSMDEIVDPEWAVGRIFTLDRQDIVQGQGVYSVVDPAKLPLPKGAATLAARTPWMLDDSDVQSPFPLSQAYADALAELVATSSKGSPTATAWLAQHPEGYLAYAEAAPSHDRYGAEVPSWILLWVQGNDWLGKQVTKASPASPWVPTVVPYPGVTIADWTPDWLPEDLASYFPPLSRVPAEFPRPAAIADRYHALFGPDAPMNGYGFQMQCANELCSTVDVLVDLGQDDRTDQRAPTDGSSIVLDKLLVDGQGKGMYGVHYTESQDGLLGLGSKPPVSQPASVAPEATGLWVFPASPAAATGVGLLGLLASALYYFWPAVKGGALSLFSRIEDDEVLENPNRARILEIIRANPGVHFQDLVRQAAVGRGTLEHHLRKLEAAELVIIKRSKGYACCFPKGVVDRRLMDAAPVLRSEGGRAVLLQVARRPGASSRDLAVELGLAPSTVSYHLKRLEQVGLVAPDPAMGARLTPLGEQAKA